MDQYARGLNDRRLSTCKVCRLGIFKGNAHTWQTSPTPGMVHTECLNEKVMEPIHP